MKTNKLPKFAECASLVAAVLLALLQGVAYAQTVYSANFETNSQGSAFTTGSVGGQGAPPWSGYFLHGYDVAGSVVSGESYLTGNQSLQIAGVQSSRVTLGAPVQNQWFEFAFKPNFGGTAATTWALTTRGGYGDAWGIKMGLDWSGTTGTIRVGAIGAGVESPGTAIGTFNNGAWQTISFKANNVVGTYEVYLGSNTLSLGTFAPAGFNGVQTLVFSSATQSWENTGNWFVDGINVGSSSLYVIPIWTGGSGDWSLTNNWANGTIPGAGSQVIFAGLGGASTNNTLSNIAGLVFSNGAGSYTVSGNAVTLGAAGIANNSGNLQTVSNNLTLGTSASFSAASGAVVVAGNTALGANALTFSNAATAAMNNSGVISGSGPMIKTGAGTLTLSGATANAYSGMTTVSEGVLQLNKTAGVNAIAGNVTIASGATLLLSASDNVADTSTVTLSGGTIIRGAGVSEAFGSLNLTAASSLDFGTGATGSMTFGTYEENTTPSALLTLNNFLPGNSFTFSNAAFAADGSNIGSYFTFGTGFQARSISDLGGNSFTITAIPEPSTYAAAAGLLAMFLCSGRRRLIRGKMSMRGCLPTLATASEACRKA